MVRSAPKERVSNHGAASSFETRPAAAPQDEAERTSMNLRPLGRSGLAIAPLMLGGNVFGWNTDQQTSSAILDAFVDEGFNAIDTADSYSRRAPGHVGGESEIIIGRWLKQSGKRDKVVFV